MIVETSTTSVATYNMMENQQRGARKQQRRFLHYSNDKNHGSSSKSLSLSLSLPTALILLLFMVCSCCFNVILFLRMSNQLEEAAIRNASLTAQQQLFHPHSPQSLGVDVDVHSHPMLRPQPNFDSEHIHSAPNKKENMQQQQEQEQHNDSAISVAMDSMQNQIQQFDSKSNPNKVEIQEPADTQQQPHKEIILQQEYQKRIMLSKNNNPTNDEGDYGNNHGNNDNDYSSHSASENAPTTQQNNSKKKPQVQPQTAETVSLTTKWEKQKFGGITLIVTDWLGALSPELLSFLENDIPDFIDETILIVPITQQVNHLAYSSSKNDKIRIVYRGMYNNNYDLCSVKINTKWFMATNSFQERYKPHPPVITTDGNRILVSVPAQFQQSFCEGNKYCKTHLAVGEAFVLNPVYFDDQDFVFHTQSRNEYCKRIIPLLHDQRFENVQPVALSYVSFLQSMGNAETYYKFANPENYKCRTLEPVFIDDRGCELDPQIRLVACPLGASKDECMTNPGCVYRPRFGCDDSNDNEIVLQKFQHEKRLLHQQQLDTEPIKNKEEMLQILRDTHKYWLDPQAAAADKNAYIPPSPRLDNEGSLPDKIFMCNDYAFLSIFFPYYEGEVYLLDHVGMMFIDPRQIEDEHIQRRNANLEIVKKYATEESLLLGNSVLLHECLPDAIVDFPGKQLLRNTEAEEFFFLTEGDLKLYPEWAKRRGLPESPNQYNYLPPSDKVFMIGPHKDTPSSIQIPLASFVVSERDYELQQKLFDPSLKHSNTKEHFLIYSASHFVSYREEAAHRLAEIGGGFHTAGFCQGTRKSTLGTRCVPFEDNERPSHIIPSPYDKASGEIGWAAVRSNEDLFSHYRFALVLENTKQDGYISEKLINAFLSGTVPIYYGTTDVFDIFNKKAFIYYDIDNPEPALQQVAYLEKNQTAYDEMTREPILAAGDETVNRWFSIRDEIGDGSIKRRVLEMLRYRDAATANIFHSVE